VGPVHILIIPKRHVVSMVDVGPNTSICSVA